MTTTLEPITQPTSPSGRARMALGGRRFLLSIAIIGASICLALGVSLPSIKLTKFYFFSTEFSLISTVWTLIQRNQIFLGSIVFIFSILLPVFKILYLIILTTMPLDVLQRQYRRLRALEWLGKWSMHDVLVLALMIFFLKSQGIYDARSLSGVYFFTAAVVFMILAYAWLNVFAFAPLRAEQLRVERARPMVGVDGRRSAFRNFLLALFILTAAICFALGVILPSIRFTTIYVWTNEHSVATIIYALYRTNEYFLAAVIAYLLGRLPVPETALPADAVPVAERLERLPPEILLDDGMARPLFDDRCHGAGADDLLHELVGLYRGARAAGHLLLRRRRADDDVRLRLGQFAARAGAPAAPSAVADPLVALAGCLIRPAPVSLREDGRPHTRGRP